MSKYYICNRADGTIEVVLPAHYTTSGYDVQLLIKKSCAAEVSKILKDPSSVGKIPRILNLVNKNLAEVVIE